MNWFYLPILVINEAACMTKRFGCEGDAQFGNPFLVTNDDHPRCPDILPNNPSLNRNESMGAFGISMALVPCYTKTTSINTAGGYHWHAFGVSEIGRASCRERVLMSV